MEWFENEEFWRTLYPYMFGEAKMAAAAGEVDRVLALSGVTGGRVLDLCCGPARHSLILARKGFDVTGVDRSPFLLSKAREAIAGATVELVESDMRDFVRPGAFDLALSLFTSFGYFETRAEDLKVLRNVRASLKPGGVFLVDVTSKEYVSAQHCTTHWERKPDGSVHVHHYDVIPGWDVYVSNGCWWKASARGGLSFCRICIPARSWRICWIARVLRTCRFSAAWMARRTMRRPLV